MAALAAMSLLLADCGEFVRNNPFDPNVPVTLTIEGPDSTVAQFDTVRFRLVTDPVYDHDPPVWASGGLDKLDDNGTFRVPQVGKILGPVWIEARLGARWATRTVKVTFQPRSFRMRACADSSRTMRFGALNDTGYACAIVRDARGGVLSTYGGIPLVATSLEPSIADIGPAWNQARSIANGSARIVYSWNGLSDTLTAIVRQQVASLIVGPSNCGDFTLKLPVGSSLQLSVAPPARDWNRNPITDPTIIQEGLAAASWYSTNGNFGSVTVTPGGLATAQYPGLQTLGVAVPGPIGSLTFGVCYITAT